MSERLDLLRPFLAKYERRFTVLDLGAGINHPTLGYEIAQEFDAVVVEVEKGWRPTPTGPRTIVLKHEFSVAELQRLGECCHFDVVLAFNVVHWFAQEWREAAEAVMGLGDKVFIQVPAKKDMESGLYRRAWPETWQEVPCMQGLLREHAQEIGSTSQFPGHPPRPIFMRQRPAPRHLSRTNWDAPNADADVRVWATPTRLEAEFRHKTPQKRRPWIPGINLWNFCRLGGVVPSAERVLTMMGKLPLPEAHHGDIQPWNMILDGERLHLIDGFEYPGMDDRQALELAKEKVRECLKTS